MDEEIEKHAGWFPWWYSLYLSVAWTSQISMSGPIEVEQAVSGNLEQAGNRQQRWASTRRKDLELDGRVKVNEIQDIDVSNSYTVKYGGPKRGVRTDIYKIATDPRHDAFTRHLPTRYVYSIQRLVGVPWYSVLWGVGLPRVFFLSTLLRRQ